VLFAALRDGAAKNLCTALHALTTYPQKAQQRRFDAETAAKDETDWGCDLDSDPHDATELISGAAAAGAAIPQSVRPVKGLAHENHRARHVRPV